MAKSRHLQRNFALATQKVNLMTAFHTDVTFASTGPNELSFAEFSFVTEIPWNEVTAAFHRGEIAFNDNGRIPIVQAEEFCARRLHERVATVLGDRHRLAGFMAGIPIVKEPKEKVVVSPYAIERGNPIPPLN